MPRKIVPRTKIPGAVGLCDPSELSKKFRGDIDRANVPTEAREAIGKAVLAFILDVQHKQNEPKNAEQKTALAEGLKRAESLKDWLTNHDQNYCDVIESYLLMNDPNGPRIPDYIASLDTLSDAMRRTQEHYAQSDQPGQNAWPGHRLTENIALALRGAGIVINANSKGVFVLTIATALDEAARIRPDAKRLNPDEDARNWARNFCKARLGA